MARFYTDPNRKFDMGLKGSYAINLFLRNLLDEKKLQSDIDKGVMPSVLLSTLMQTKDDIYKSRFNRPKKRTGLLVNNIFTKHRKDSWGFYVGFVYVTNNVPYARIQELGGVIKQKITQEKRKEIKSRMTVEQYRQSQYYRKRLKTIVIPPRPYLWPPAKAVTINAFYVSFMNLLMHYRNSSMPFHYQHSL
jgi:hypothetical protein